MVKTKKVKFLDLKLSNHSVDEAEKRVLQMFQAVRELGEEMIDVKIDFFAKKEVTDNAK